MAMSAASADGDATPWYFRPTGKRPAKEIAKLSPGFDREGWQRVSLPFRFDPIQPESNVYGWYVHEVEVPQQYEGRDLYLDLGIVDDADVTYFNGRRVGGMGNFSTSRRSAWNKDRRYRVPAGAVNYGESNVLAVQAKDFGGLGGLLGQPHVGVVLAEKWKCRFRAGTGDAEEMASPGPGLDDPSWQAISLPDTEWDARQRKDPSWGWYRYSFDLSSDLSRQDLLVDLGRLYDAAECYLNGELAGRMGRFPPEEFLQTAGRLRLVLPAGRLKEGKNVLAVRVYNQSEFGGLVGIPTVALDDQLLLGETGLVAPLLRRSADLPAERLLDLCDYLVHSGRAAEVSRICRRIAGAPDGDPSARHRALALRVYALWLEGLRAEAWREFQMLDFTRPIPYHAAAVASRLRPARGSAEEGVLHGGRDTELQGNWNFRYGLQDAVLCAMGSPASFNYGTRGALEYELDAGSGDEVVRAWVGAKRTSDRRALYSPMSGRRRYASWDDRGEVRPFDDEGPDLLVSVRVPAGPHLLALYLVDWDWYGGAHPRMQTITVLDKGQEPLAVVATGKFGAGQYERFLIQGPTEITFRVSKHRSPCAILSGLFLDPVVPLQTAPSAKNTEVLKELSLRYDDLADHSKRDLLSLTEAQDLRRFEGDCRQTARKDDDARPVLWWWVAECRRIRGAIEESQEALRRYAWAVMEDNRLETRKKISADLTRLMNEKRYRPEALMAVKMIGYDLQNVDWKKRLTEWSQNLRITMYGRVVSRWTPRRKPAHNQPLTK